MSSTFGSPIERAEGAHHSAQLQPLDRHMQHALTMIDPGYDLESLHTIVPRCSRSTSLAARFTMIPWV